VLKSPTDLDLAAISVSLLLKQMKREDRVNVVILDACRDNPFATALAKNKTRAVVDEHGLSRIDGDLARGTLIAFASDPKSTALDGPAGQHSPFTEAFLDHVADPGVSIDTLMNRVRTEVWEKTKHSQLPWVNTSLIGDYALNPQASSEGAADVEKVSAGAPSSPVPTNEKQSHEDLLWESAQHSNLSADYQAYLDAFPNGLFAQMARNRIASLQGAGATGTAPTPETSAPAEPVGSSEKEFISEIGTVETEKALNLTPANQTEIQQRLIVLEFYKGPTNGALDSLTRSAIGAWQESRGLAPTSFLGSLQLAALRAESENMYQRYLAAPPAPRRAQAIKQRTRPTTSAAKTPSAPARHWAHRSSPPLAAAAASAAATPDPGGTPAWRRRAGLPDNSPTPGRPPGY
jgi:peptidoglycan hydrolase-like protein with peptidoglycan-binding domain